MSMKRYLALSRAHDWQNAASVFAVATFFAGIFIPTIGTVPFGCLGIACAFCFFRAGVWMKNATRLDD
ncbi:hypothetical protein CcrColossus_gp383 [Caulobacter phage CcrColossus]|uniref:Uncharacterized protein n=1 Tax=Caulobacter phage CcrColossus TaxID=1211640 RepID=K4JWG9_9CAUD|nr:hypothetical protein CcrColossus_gp383 [Caulobacter phage CcrColossus]AFU88253.1 hypothetical protein CcrColossus_gp383 [Caulobacter phage CcrColossus]